MKQSIIIFKVLMQYSFFLIFIEITDRVIKIEA